MPKLKTHSGAKKRFKISKRGKVLHKKAGQRHLLAGWSSKWGRSNRRKGQLPKGDADVIKALLPYA
ncbi:MAG: 50S ribosomal protein L35 [Elusimicrobia bacterium]|nr:50S ribosomal protein L35 [Elusimicrobiota bacterium]